MLGLCVGLGLGIGQNGAWQGVTVTMTFGFGTHAWKRIRGSDGKEANNPGRRFGICFGFSFDYLMMVDGDRFCNERHSHSLLKIGFLCLVWIFA